MLAYLSTPSVSGAAKSNSLRKMIYGIAFLRVHLRGRSAETLDPSWLERMIAKRKSTPELHDRTMRLERHHATGAPTLS